MDGQKAPNTTIEQALRIQGHNLFYVFGDMSIIHHVKIGRVDMIYGAIVNFKNAKIIFLAI